MTTVPTEDITVPEMIEKALATYRPSTAAIAEMSAAYMPLVVRNEDDKVGYATVRAARLVVKEKRVAVEKCRVALKEGALRYGQAVDAEARRLTALLSPIEAHLQAQENIVAQATERRRLAEEAAALDRLRERMARLAEAHSPAIAEDVRDLSAQEFDALLAVAVQRKAERVAAERAEAARLAQEAERLAAERAELARQRAEHEAKVAAERAAADAEASQVRAAQQAEADRLAAERAALDAARREQERLAEAQAAEERTAADRIFGGFEDELPDIAPITSRPATAQRINYSPEIDAIIYGTVTDYITNAPDAAPGWLALAMACLDQAGLSLALQIRIKALAVDALCATEYGA
jgi:hypothetical protein